MKEYEAVEISLYEIVNENEDSRIFWSILYSNPIEVIGYGIDLKVENGDIYILLSTNE